MTIEDLIRRVRESITTTLAEREGHQRVITEVRATCETAGRRDPSAAEAQRVVDAQTAIARLDGELTNLREREKTLLAEKAADDEYLRRASESYPTGVTVPGGERTWSGASGLATPAPSTGGVEWVRSRDRLPAVVARGQRFGDHPIVSRYGADMAAADAAVIGQHGSLGQMVRSMTTTTGSAIVPTVWAADLIDRARNYSAVLKAGAQIVPMDAKTVEIGRLTADPTAVFRTEGSTVTASDPTFDNVTLTAKTLSALVVGSLEWFQDADNVDQVVTNAIAKAIGLRLDLVSLFGGLTTGDEVAADALNETFATPPNPRGILADLLANASSNVLGGATNGTTQTAASFWSEVQSAIFTVLANNETPNAMLWPSKLAQKYTDAYDTTNQPLRMPENIAALPKFVTNQIPAGMTPGTGTNMADLFVGDFNQLLIGQRLGLTIQTLTERYAENGQVAIIAHWRGDTALARSRAFSVYRYIKAAS